MLDLPIMNTHNTEEIAALEILKQTGVSLVEAALVARAALEAGHGRVKRAMKCVQLGTEELKRQENTVTFGKAVEAAMEARKERRARTQSDFRYIARRFMKRCKGLAQRRMRSIRSQECTRYIEESFDTPSQRAKARRVLSGIFGTAMKRGWCSENPVARVDVPIVKERQIEILTPQEIESLLQSARGYEGGKCMAAVGMMLYAGIRPHEVARLRWEDIDIEGRSIGIAPQHSKTGGARMVSIPPPLLRLLQACPQGGRICPPQWLRHWRELRKQAGFTHWQPDVLRHTFASYHLRHFRDYTALQYETGHRDSSLLRTRYVNMRGVGNTSAFWG